MEPSQSNPYQPPSDLGSGGMNAPAGLTAEGAGLEDFGYVRSALGQTAARWIAVCLCSAVPSFLFGFMSTGGEIWAMLTGIAIFAVGYTTLDYQTAGHPWRRKTLIRKTLRVAYGTRVAISILIPIGAYLDVICGIVSHSIAGAFIDIAALESVDSAGIGSGIGFWAALLLTLIQGCVLNVVLAVYGGAILGIGWLVGRLKK